VDTTYAAPTGSSPRVLSAAASRQVTNCSNTILARGHLGIRSAGNRQRLRRFPPPRISSSGRDDAGKLLATIREFDASYDALGNPVGVVAVREDGAVRTAQVVYDTFGLAPIHDDRHRDERPRCCRPRSHEILSRWGVLGTHRRERDAARRPHMMALIDRSSRRATSAGGESRRDGRS